MVGITAGASAPEVLVEDVIEALRRIGPVEVSTLPGREENIEFRLPAELTEGLPPGRSAGQVDLSQYRLNPVGGFGWGLPQNHHVT